jgi:hypothetical protein
VLGSLKLGALHGMMHKTIHRGIETSAVSAPSAAALRSFATTRHAAVRRQVPLDQRAHVGERDQLHDIGNDQRLRQRAGPVRLEQGTG